MSSVVWSPKFLFHFDDASGNLLSDIVAGVQQIVNLHGGERQGREQEGGGLLCASFLYIYIYSFS